MKSKDIFLMTEEEKLRAIEEAELRLSLRQDLPFLYGYKHYDWSRAFFESKNHICLLVAANQLGKSTANIRHKNSLINEGENFIINMIKPIVKILNTTIKAGNTENNFQLSLKRITRADQRSQTLS